MELETRFNQAHDVSGLVATEVGKHHSAFSLLGSEVERVRQRLQTSETAAVAMRNAIDKIVEEIESWEDGARGATDLALPPGIDLRGKPPPGSCGDDRVAPGIDLRGKSVPDNRGDDRAAPGIDLRGKSVPDNCGDDRAEPPAWDPWRLSAQRQAQGGAQGALGFSPASNATAAAVSTSIKFSEET